MPSSHLFSFFSKFSLLVLVSLTTLSFAQAKDFVLAPVNKETFQKALKKIEQHKIYLENHDGKKVDFTLEDLQKVVSIEEISGIKIADTIVQVVPDTEGSYATEKYTKISITNHEELLNILLGDKKDTFYKPVENITIKKLSEGNKYDIQGRLLDGYEIDMRAFEEMLLEIFNTSKNIRVIKVPEQFTKAQIIQSEKPEEALELVTQGISDFKGSTKNRIHNIVTAYTHFEGHVIESGEEFSFNAILGPVDGSTGYAKELVIKGPKTVPDWGGGVCQVSSTVFRAALNAGLPILERRNHSYAVSYYEPWGTDATIYPGVQDLKFKNDTGAPIVMHIYHEGTKLYVNFYGKKDGRQVELQGPTVYDRQGTPSPTVEVTSSLATGKQVLKEYGHPGFSAYWIRTVTKANNEKTTTKFNSIYEARPGHVLRGA